MLVTLLLVPETAGEVWEGYGCAVVIHRNGAQLSQRAPLSQIVNVHIQRQTVLQAVNQTGIHDEVHTSVTHLAPQLTILLQDWVIVFLHQRSLLLLVHEAVSIEIIHLRRSCSLQCFA